MKLKTVTRIEIDGTPYTIGDVAPVGHGWLSCILHNSAGVADRAKSLPSWFLKCGRKGSAIYTSGERVVLA